MTYHNEVIYQVWFQGAEDEKPYLDECFYHNEEAIEYCANLTKEINANPNWGYSDFSMFIEKIPNPSYDRQRVEDENKADWIYHKDI